MHTTKVEHTSLATQEIGFDPEVKSYRLVIRAPNVPERQNGLYRSEEYRHELQRTFNVGKVIKVGPLAFVGETQQHYKVDEGDWVWYSKYEREVVSGPKNALCYFINDDRILGRVKPEDLETILNGAT